METSQNRTDNVLLLVLISVGLVVAGTGLLATWVGLGSQAGFGPARALLFAGGVFLSAISWWYLRSGRVDERWLWPLALASLLLVGGALRLAERTYDRFDYDEYDLMVGVDRGLVEYLERQSLTSVQFLVHYWMSYRVLGGSLTAYRSMSLLAGVALLPAAVVLLRRSWPSQKTTTLVVLLILIVNADALYLTRYALFPYGSTFLLSAALFFLFMRLAEGPLENKQWLWITAILPIAAFFSNEFLIVPVATGAFSVLVFRWARSSGSRSLATLWKWVWELKPLLIFPTVYAIKQTVHPTTAHWGPSARTDQVDLYFPTSGYAPTLAGILKFLLDKTYSLFASVLTPAGISDRPSLELVFLACCSFLAALALLQAVRRRADGRTVFTAFFLLTTLAAIAMGSLLGLYPYGIVRYTPYLFMPSAALIGIGASITYRWVFERLRLPRSSNALLAWLTVVVLIGGAYLCVVRSAQIARTHKDDAQAIAWLESRQPDLILADNYIATVLYTKAPAIYARLHQMGWGTYMERGQDVVPAAMADTITEVVQSPPIERILVVLYPNELGRTDRYEGFAQRFPAWNELIEANFDPVASQESLHLAAKLYIR